MSSEQQRAWWQDGVIYQIYPRSFADANGDGIGDLRGIIEHLDYLNDGTEQSLGIDAIWLSPVYPSPMHDFGYDVSDYRAISPEFGTMDDFRELLDEAHTRGIRIIMDLVLNHTSHEHPWFVEARASRNSHKRDWYIWQDGQKGKRPNNWLGAFGGHAWEWDTETLQYYLHTFLPEQPDVNWRNPDLREAMWDVVQYWLELGVDGFRLDVVNWFVKDAELRNNPTRAIGRRPYDRQQHIYDRNRPESIDIMKDIRRIVEGYPDRMTVGEVWQEPPGDPALPNSYMAEGAGLHMAFNFAFTWCKWNPEAFAHVVSRWETELCWGGWPNYTLSNHDVPRAISRYAVGGEAEPRARVAAAMLLTLRGTPFLYYGEEIGMRNGKVAKHQLQDPLGKRYWPAQVGRDPARTPMPWNADANAGFTTGSPWLPVNRDYEEISVAAAEADPGSMLHWYRRLIHLRKREPALYRGWYTRIEGAPATTFAYLREWGEDRIAVLLNFDRFPETVTISTQRPWTVLAGTHQESDGAVPGGVVDLAGYEVLILKAQPAQRI